MIGLILTQDHIRLPHESALTLKETHCRSYSLHFKVIGMKKNFSLRMQGQIGLLLILFVSCSKNTGFRDLPSLIPGPACDTCRTLGGQADKEVILYAVRQDWVFRGGGRYECDLEPLLANQANPVDSIYIDSMVVGVAGNARQIKRGTAINYDEGTLVWFGFKLNFQAADSQTPPGLLTIRLAVRWLQ
jgi:hypothetical protein